MEIPCDISDLRTVSLESDVDLPLSLYINVQALKIEEDIRRNRGHLPKKHLEF